MLEVKIFEKFKNPIKIILHFCSVAKIEPSTFSSGGKIDLSTQSAFFGAQSVFFARIWNQQHV